MAKVPVVLRKEKLPGKNLVAKHLLWCIKEDVKANSNEMMMICHFSSKELIVVYQILFLSFLLCPLNNSAMYL